MVLLRILGVVCYALLAVVILGFIFSNREPVAVEIFPLGQTNEFPLYVLLCVMFCAGLLLGLLHSITVWAKLRRHLARATRAISQLEKEIAAKPPTA